MTGKAPHIYQSKRMDSITARKDKSHEKRKIRPSELQKKERAWCARCTGTRMSNPTRTLQGGGRQVKTNRKSAPPTGYGHGCQPSGPQMAQLGSSCRRSTAVENSGLSTTCYNAVTLRMTPTKKTTITIGVRGHAPIMDLARSGIVQCFKDGVCAQYYAVAGQSALELGPCDWP